MAMVSTTTGATRLGWVCLSVLVAGEADRRKLSTNTIILFAFVLAVAFVTSGVYFWVARMFTKKLIYITAFLKWVFLGLSLGNVTNMGAALYSALGPPCIISLALTTLPRLYSSYSPSFMPSAFGHGALAFRSLS
jgi:hypothetical protein